MHMYITSYLDYWVYRWRMYIMSRIRANVYRQLFTLSNYSICISRSYRWSFSLVCTIVLFFIFIFFTYISYITPLPIRLSSLTSYYIPRDGPQSSYKEYISMLPPTEHPEVFGQHPNADIASQIAETRTLFDTLLSLQPQVSSTTAAGAGPSREDKVRGKQEGSKGGQKCLSWVEIHRHMIRPTM